MCVCVYIRVYIYICIYIYLLTVGVSRSVLSDCEISLKLAYWAQLNFSRYCRHSVSDLDEFRRKLCARAALFETTESSVKIGAGKGRTLRKAVSHISCSRVPCEPRDVLRQRSGRVERCIVNYLHCWYSRDGVCLLRGTDWVFIYTGMLISR
jgi:hypothetical protein